VAAKRRNKRRKLKPEPETVKPLIFRGGGGGPRKPKDDGGGIGDVVGDVVDTVTDAAGDVVDAVGEVAGDVANAAGEAASAATTAASTASSSPAVRAAVAKAARQKRRQERRRRRPVKIDTDFSDEVHSATDDVRSALDAVQADEYREKALKKVAAKHLDVNDKGQLKTTKEKIPKFKTSEADVQRDLKRLNSEVKSLKRQGATRKELRRAKRVGAKQVVARNYQLDKRGKVQYETVKVPKIKTAPGKLQSDLRKVNKRSQAIRTNRKQFPLGDPITKSDIFGGGGVSGAISDVGGDLLSAAGDAFTGKQITETVSKVKVPTGRGSNRTYSAGGLAALPKARQTALRGIRTGLLVGADYLSRPGLAIEAQIAKSLGNDKSPLSFLVSEKQKAKLRRAAGPSEAFLHGLKDEDVIAGKELSEALIGDPQAGLLIDLGTDPTLWVGGGALVSRLGQKYAMIENRILKNAPELLSDAKTQTLIKSAHSRGDYEGVVKHLEGLAKGNNVSLKSLGRTKADRVAAREFEKLPGKRLEKIVEGIKEKRKDNPLFVPEREAQEAVAEVAKLKLRTRIDPGFQINFHTPLGRHLGALRFKLPDRIANSPGIRIGRANSEKARLLKNTRIGNSNERIDTQFAGEHQRLLDEVAALRSTPTASRQQVNAAERQLKQFEDKVRKLKSDAAQKIERSGVSTITPKEFTQVFNDRKLAHEIARVSNAGAARNIQMRHFENVARALAPIKNDLTSRMKVQAHQMELADTGGDSIMRTVAPLNDVEQQALRDLQASYYEMARAGIDSGTIERTLADYVPREFVRGADVRQATKDFAHDEAASRVATNADFTYHRGVFETASLTDKNKLAQIIQDISGRNWDEALESAEKWYQRGRMKVAIEDMANSIQRGFVLREENMTELQKLAYEWANRMKANSRNVPPVFQDLAKTEGVLKMHPDAFRFHDFVEDPFTGLSTAQARQLRHDSTAEWISRLEDARDAADQPDLVRDYQLAIDQRKAELEDYMVPAKVDEAVTTAIDVLKTKSGDWELTKLANGNWQAQRVKREGEGNFANISGEFASRDEAVAMAESPDPLRYAYQNDVRSPERNATPDKLTQAEEELAAKRGELDKLQGELTHKKAYHVVLRTDKGNLLKTIQKTFDDPEEAYELAAQIDESGGLLDDVVVKVEEVPEASAGVKKSLAEQYAETADALEAIEKQVEKLKADAPKDAAKKVREDTPAPTPNVPIQTADSAGLPKDDELLDFVPNPSEEYLGTLKDFRDTHPDKFPVMDPLVANYSRTLRQALRNSFHARWKAVDQSVGRSERDALGGTYRLSNGKSGSTAEIVPDYGDIDDIDTTITAPIGYKNTNTGETYDLTDIEFPDRTLIKNSKSDIWYDPTTGKEYTRVDETIFGREAIGKDRLWPTEQMQNIKAEFFRMGENVSKDVFDDGIDKMFVKTMSLIRFGVTTYFPAYHVRNMVSDAYQSLLADPGVMFHPITNTKLASAAMRRGGNATIKIKGLGSVKTEDALLMMDTFGLRSNQHLSEFVQLAEKGSLREAGRLSRSLRTLGPSGSIGGKALEFSARREDIIRLQTFVQRMRRNNGDAADAMWYTIKHHFDYNDLNQLERRTMRNLFLFYTWYRKNIPLQFISMITRPGFFSAMTTFYRDLAEGATPFNMNWSKLNPILPDMSGPVPNPGLVPDYMLTKLATPTVNWNGHAVAIGVGYPWADTNLVTNFLENPVEGARTGLSLLGPGLTLPIQLGLRSDLLTGRDYDQVEASGWSNLFNQMGISLPVDDEGNPALPWQVNLLLNQIPIGGRASSYFRPTKPDEDPGRFNKYFGGGWGTFLSGVNVYVSPKEGERLNLAYLNRVYARAGQRSALQAANASDKEMAEFDKQTNQWAKELQIPHKYLEVIATIGPAYVTEEERQGFKLDSGGGILSGGSSAGILGGKLDLGGGKEEETESTIEKAMKKVQGEDGGEEFKLAPLLGQGIAGFSNSTGVEAADISQGQLSKYEARLRKNSMARQGKLLGKDRGREKEDQKDRTLGPLEKRGAKYLKQHTKAKAHNDTVVKKQKLKQRQELKQQFGKKLRKLKAKVNEGKLPKFSGFVDKDQEQFAQWLSYYSGLPPELVGPWVLAEGGGEGSEGISGGEAGKNNWLGVGYPGERTELSNYHKLNEDPKTAAKFTSDWLKGGGLPDGSWKAEARIPEIITMKDRSPEEIMNFIGNESGWGTGTFELGTVDVVGYGGKKNPQAEARLKKVEAAAKKAGFDPDDLGQSSTVLRKNLAAKKFKGAWAGSGAVLKTAVKGFEISSEKRSPDDPLSISNPGSDHNEANENAFAYDLPTTDGEPIAHTVAERLGIKGYQTGDYTAYVSPKYPGYEFQILWAVEGHYDHVHVGAHWTGEDLPKGTYLGGPTGGGGGGVISGSPVSTGGAAPSTGGSGATGGGGYRPGRSKIASMDAKQIRKNVMGAGGGKSSVGFSSLLTTNEAYNLGSGARKGRSIVQKVEEELAKERRSALPAATKMPRYRST
jgi:hypothetical protein